jgi:hypothetical protein
MRGIKLMFAVAAATLFLGSNAMAQGASSHSGLIQGDPAEDPNTPTPLLYGTTSVGGGFRMRSCVQAGADGQGGRAV